MKVDKDKELSLLQQLESDLRKWFADPEAGEVSCQAQHDMAATLFKLNALRNVYPEFVAFHVGHGWEVKLSNNCRTVHIGCMSFPLKSLHAALNELCTGEASGKLVDAPKYEGRYLKAKRDGISLEIKKDEDNKYIPFHVKKGYYKINWDEADTLMKSLQPYLGA